MSFKERSGLLIVEPTKNAYELRRCFASVTTQQNHHGNGLYSPCGSVRLTAVVALCFGAILAFISCLECHSANEAMLYGQML